MNHSDERINDANVQNRDILLKSKLGPFFKMSGPGEDPQAHNFLDPASIEELRARVAARRAARTQRAQVSREVRGRPDSDIHDPPERDMMGDFEEEMKARRALLAVRDARMGVHDHPVPAAAAAATPAPLHPLSEEEARMIRKALEQADADDDLLLSVSAAKSAAPSLSLSQTGLVRAIVDWMLEDADMDDTFHLDAQARFFVEYGPDSRHPPESVNAALKAELDISQTSTRKLSQPSVIDYFDKVVRNCSVDLKDIWIIDFMLQEGSLGAFQFNELCKLGPALSKRGAK
jgi:hypothetical protein